MIPDLNGVWKGGRDSDWVNPETNEKLPTIPAKLTIKQTLFNISCVLETKESSSRSLIANFVIDSDNQKSQLVYTYQNDPHQTIQDRSRIHYGTAILNIKKKNNGMLLEGIYWTGRNTSGNMSFSGGRKNKKK